MLKEIRKLFDSNEIKHLYFLVGFSVLVSFGEVFGLSMIVPFISIASNKDSLYENKYLELAYKLFKFENYSQFIIYLGILIVIIFLLKNVVNIIFNCYLVNFTRNNYYKITCKLMNNYLKYQYKNYIDENSDVLSKNLITECNLIVTVLQYLLLFVSEIIVIVTIYIVMLIVNFKITIFTSSFLLIAIIFIKIYIINKTNYWGIQRASAMENYYKIVGATFGNYKFIKLLSNEEQINKKFEIVCNNYIKVDKKFQETQPIPKFVLEFLGFFIVIVLIVGSIIAYGEKGMIEIMPIITIFFIGLYRILPSLN
ncbi:ABC transporter transmembrane domain-containing protein, partial [Fusobacterium mortiferum]